VIVVDASIVLRLVAQIEPVSLLDPLKAFDPWIAPAHLDLEVLNALRRYVRLGLLTERQAASSIETLNDVRLVRYSPHRHISRLWDLRNNVSPYDAAYLALAEFFQMPLYTHDARLASSPGHKAKIILI
jgi:predicted nucleic acid-binding protein